MPDEQYATGGFVSSPADGDLPLVPLSSCGFVLSAEQVAASTPDVKLIFNPERLKGWDFTAHGDGTWTMTRRYGRQYQEDPDV